MNLFCVSDCCPVGCGIQVVLLQARGRGPLFCYCDGCGCAWATPAETLFEAGLHATRTPADFAPQGVDLPTRDAIVQAGWDAAILAVVPTADWTTSLEDVNADIANITVRAQEASGGSVSRTE